MTELKWFLHGQSTAEYPDDYVTVLVAIDSLVADLQPQGESKGWSSYGRIPDELWNLRLTLPNATPLKR